MSNKLTLSFNGYNDALTTLTINGKCAKIKNKKGVRTCIVETKESTAEIVFFKSHNYIGKLWWLWSILCFFVSLFGILDIPQEKRCLTVDCRFKINLESETNVTLNVQRFEDGGKFLEIESSTGFEEISNIQCFDKVGQKRHKIFKKIKKGIIFGTLAIAILLIIIF